MRVHLIDANSLGRVLHAGEPRCFGSLQTQAVAGVLEHARRTLRDAKDVLLVYLWDGRARWRYELLASYKSSRHRSEEQRQARAHYEAQVPWIRKALSHLPVLQVEHPHAEADDLAFGLSRALSQQGHLVTLRTADTDWLQLVSPRVEWQDVRKTATLVSADNFHQTTPYGRPDRVAPVKALSGDESDDIDGVPGIALKRATALLAQYGDLTSLLEASRDVLAFSAQPRWAHMLMLEEMRERLQRNMQLVDLSRGPALEGDHCLLTVGEPDEMYLYEVFVDLGLSHWLDDSFEAWSRILRSRSISLDQAASARRALRDMPRYWPQSANRAEPE